MHSHTSLEVGVRPRRIRKPYDFLFQLKHSVLEEMKSGKSHDVENSPRLLFPQIGVSLVVLIRNSSQHPSHLDYIVPHLR